MFTGDMMPGFITWCTFQTKVVVHFIPDANGNGNVENLSPGVMRFLHQGKPTGSAILWRITRIQGHLDPLIDGWCQGQTVPTVFFGGSAVATCGSEVLIHSQIPCAFHMVTTCDRSQLQKLRAQAIPSREESKMIS